MHRRPDWETERVALVRNFYKPRVYNRLSEARGGLEGVIIETTGDAKLRRKRKANKAKTLAEVLGFKVTGDRGRRTNSIIDYL